MAVKGRTNNPHGRKVGSKNVKTEQWEELGHALISKHSGRANEIMSNCDDDTFMDNFHKLLEYFKPKQSRAVVQQEGVSQIEVVVRRPDGER